MKRYFVFFFILFVTVFASACDALPDDGKEATKEYCDENPNDVICDGFESEDPLDNLVSALFQAMVEDYNDDSDGFDCDAYFDTVLSAECQNNTSFFAPSGYNGLLLREFSEKDIENMTIGYELTMNTNIITDIIVFSVGLVRNDNDLDITHWSHEVKDNDELTANELRAHRFIIEYNNASLESVNLCNKWINNSIDASNCALIRRSRMTSNQTFEFVSVVPGTYTMLTVKLLNAGGETNSNEKYVMFDNGKFGNAEFEFRITDQFNTDSYGFLNKFANSDPNFHDACELLDSGVNECKAKRADYLEIGITEVTNATAGSSGIVNGYLQFYNIMSYRLDDDSTVTLTFICRVVDGKHEYEITNYDD